MSAFPSKPLHCVHMKKKKKNRQGAAKAGSQPASAKVFMLCWLCAAEQISALANAAGVCSALEGEQCGSRHSVQANTEALTWDLKCLTCVISGRFFWVWCMHVARGCSQVILQGCKHRAPEAGKGKAKTKASFPGKIYHTGRSCLGRSTKDNTICPFHPKFPCLCRHGCRGSTS